MTTALYLINPRVARITSWLSARPALVRLALPVVLALAAALLSHNAAYAQPGSGGSGG